MTYDFFIDFFLFRKLKKPKLLYMRTFGVLFLLGGIALGICAFLMDTTVPVQGSSFLDIDRVSNLGLMNQKECLLIVAGVLCLMGSIFIGSDHVSQSLYGLKIQPPKTKSNISSISKNDIQPNAQQIELQNQYDSGELTFEQFQSELGKLKAQHSTL
jgi:hypothetical protein